ncbi:FKBP-type peptidyl-prolyl cis-trans isomerase [Candidatus Enterovibrio escicola]|uniref:Peptidyl-prolyl cis-trans isomerase n=1 Tax=Candidatus Enterovibrio escicola TaxID=1927127 RepID=A0A2A5T5T5_9GAMM|nr:FKBP-type peptidyl-prolyl cis-trans isomerase [Candidatus Enterovibrio escacola]PCS23559.1 FKBP-type peptidyl-prolyl cis-trans isomerase SlpA [Candidatus Enterovibrio escacola]
MTQISFNSEVVMHFSIKLENGSVADSTHNVGKPAKFNIGDGNLTDNFEECLLGLKQGEIASFTLEPSYAFGVSNPDNVKHMDRSKFVGDIPVDEGTIVSFSGPSGKESIGVIAAVIGESVTVDFNHPLAGQRVIFDVEIISVS